MNSRGFILLLLSTLCPQPTRCELGHTTPLLVSHPHKSIRSLGEGTNHRIKIGLEVFGEYVTLNLIPNYNLFHINYVYQHLNADSHTMSQSGVATLCHYKGHVECVGCKYTRAFVSTCHLGLRGLFSFNQTDYFIEPLLRSQDEEHLVYTRVADGANYSEVLQGSNEWLGKVAHSQLRSVRSYVLRTRRYYLESLVVLDGTMVAHHGAATQSYALTIMNIVAGLLSHPSLGEHFSLVVSRLITTSPGADTFNWNSDDPNKSLPNFCEWQHRINGTQDRPTHDLALVFTRRSLCVRTDTCSVLGRAFVAALCSGNQSCLMVRDRGLMLAGSTVAQEMGRLFGSHHDENSKKCGAFAIQNRSSILTQRFISATNHFRWSSCSRHSIADYLSRGGDACILNKPTNQIRISGLELTADERCRSSLGPIARAVPSQTTCGALTCSSTPETNRWVILSIPMQDGTDCSINGNIEGRCLSGLCVRKGNRDPSINGRWAEWHDWSDCSHSCGLGVRQRERTCSTPAPTNGGEMCPGDRHQLSTCRLSLCSSSQPSRRDLKCQQKYGGTWLALPDKYGVDNPCALFCQKQDTEEIKFHPSVEDGTECHGSFPEQAMCLLGNCVPVDCNGEFAGEAQLDACGVCNGGGTSCHFVSGTIREDLPHYDLHRLLSIPPWARKVTLTHFTPRPNVYLVVSQLGENLLLSPNLNSIIHCVPWNSATLSNGSVTFSTPGPTSDLLEIKLFGGPTHVELFYSYSVPPVQEARLASEEVFRCVADFMCHSCNSTCGTAVEECIPRCVDANNYTISHLICDRYTKLLNTSMPCKELSPCPTYIWASLFRYLCRGTQNKKHLVNRDKCVVGEA